MDKNQIIITSALPYANGSIHIGHLVEYIQTDIIARALKLAGEDVVFCCADDTHGAPIQIKAQQLGITPKELIDKSSVEHQEDFASYNIKFDSYYSTDSKENKFLVNSVYKRLKDKDLIYEKEIELTYCENCERFLPDRFVKGSCPKCEAQDQYGDVCEKCNQTYETVDLVKPYCTICKSTPIRKNSNHLFFKLSTQADILRKFLTENNLQKEVVNQIMNWVDEGLKDWCISRDAPYFGFKIPDSDKYFYVWLDAPIGYISSFTNFLGGDLDKAEKEWNNSKIIHVIGKDIMYFHLLFWPAVLANSEFKLPDEILVHGFLTVNGEKMSKSRGTFLTAKEFLDYADPELLRFYYAANLSRTMTDINLDLVDFTNRANNELVSNIANFMFRTLSFLKKNYDGKIIESEPGLSPDFSETINFYKTYELRKAVNSILAISSEGNKYFQEKQPWDLIKTDKEAAHRVLSTCTRLVKDLAIILKPIMPVFAANIEKQLNLGNQNFKDLESDLNGHQINQPQILYRKIEEVKIKENKFSKLNLKVAEIKDVSNHPDAEKLYVIKLDMGEERQIVAGMKPHYPKEDLVGKKIIVVSNLEPVNLRGVKSAGMMMAASEGEKVGFLYVENAKPGDQVLVDGANPNPDQIKFKEFQDIELLVKDKVPSFEGKPFKVNGESVKVDKDIINGKIS